MTSAGNSAKDIDFTGNAQYPAFYDLDNIITVAATDQNDGLASFSNYGTASVDIGAPGTNIQSSFLFSTNSYSETFSVTPTTLPTGYVASGSSAQWLTKTVSSNIRLHTTSGSSYTGNENTTVRFSGFSLSGKSNARVEFDTKCETEYLLGSFQDYVRLEIAT